VLPIELVETAPVETTLGRADVPDAADVWLDMIGGARHTIELAEFYASDAPGGRLEPIVRALEAATARGVTIRFLVEASFVKLYPDTLARLAHAGVAVRHLRLGTGGILHAKYFVVDGRDAFLGSQNFDWRALEHNLELGARVRDPAVIGGIAAVFAADWARAGGEPAPAATAIPASALVASPKDLLPAGVAWDLPRLIALVDGAKTSIHVQLLTYLAGDWDELEAPLRRAAARGVTVELVLADWMKRASTLAGAQQLAKVPHVEIRLVTIPLATRGFIPFARVTHAKLLVVDGARGWLGTGNWERDYFYQSRNLGLVVDDAALVGQLERFFDDTWRSPYASRLDPDATYAPPRVGDGAILPRLYLSLPASVADANPPIEARYEHATFSVVDISPFPFRCDGCVVTDEPLPP
jgi:phosphatidylserine/phosphatidylglycerophosphate/cardiolipin synthase-like enzyme